MIVGTRPFIAPEILKKRRYSFKSDLFAVGVLFFTLAFGSYPFREARITDPQYFLLMQGNYEKFWSKLKKGGLNLFDLPLKGLIQSMLSHIPENRPEITEIFAIP